MNPGDMINPLTMMFSNLPVFVNKHTEDTEEPTYAVPLSTVIPRVIESESPIKGIFTLNDRIGDSAVT